VTDWKTYWATYPTTIGPSEHLKQVGHTIKGAPVPDWLFQLKVSEILRHLDLQSNDTVLDLCCGNGVITKELAYFCKRVVGVDYSLPLLEIANREHQAGNISYRHSDILNLDNMSQVISEPFSKVLIHGGLQYFQERHLGQILGNILRLTANDRVILLGGVPDIQRIWQFYNTPKRRLIYLWSKIRDKDVIGTWWDKEVIGKTCQKLGLDWEFHNQNPALDTAGYRFDVTIF